jgi:hypothetical protein
MAKVRAQGADIRLTSKTETTYGTAATPNYRILLATRLAGGGSKPIGYEAELGRGPDAQEPYFDPLDVDPVFDVHMRVREIGYWLFGLFGAPVTTGAGPFTHVFSSGGELPSRTYEEGHIRLTTANYYLRTGVKLAGFSLPWARKGPAKMTINAIAQNVARSTSSSSGTPVANYAEGKFFNKALLVNKDGAALGQLVGGALNFSNGLEKVESVGRGDGLIEGADETERTAEGTMDLRLTSSAVMWNHAMVDEDSFALVMRYTTPEDAAFKLDFEFGKVFVGWSHPEIAVGGIMKSLPWRASVVSPTVPLLEVTLVNDVATYS